MVGGFSDEDKLVKKSSHHHHRIREGHHQMQNDSDIDHVDKAAHVLPAAPGRCQEIIKLCRLEIGGPPGQGGERHLDVTQLVENPAVVVVLVLGHL